jgi:hypothetical protein
VIRVFLLTGSYVDVQDVTLEELDEALEDGSRFVLHGIGKAGERLSIRLAAIAYAAKYADD